MVIPHHNRYDLLAKQIEWLDKHDYEYVVVRGMYFAEACNAGAKDATKEWLVFLNDDIVLDSFDVIADVIRDADEHGWDICEPTLYNADGSLQMRGVRFTRNSRGALMATRNKTEKPAHCIGGAFLFIKTAIFEELKGFDEAYKNGYEDLDLSCRARLHFAEQGVSKHRAVHLGESSARRHDFEDANLKRFAEKHWQYMTEVLRNEQ